MEKRNVLAFDLGASSGRAVLGVYENKSIKLKEVYRFLNNPVNMRGVLYWDILRLFHEIKRGILAAKSEGVITSLGVDTWGLDFGLLDSEGRLLENPVHYRDSRTKGMKKVCDEVLGSSISLFETTGIQFLESNTIYQLLSIARDRPALLENAETLLLMPNLINYMLTDQIYAEYSIAMTTQLVDTHTGTWSKAILDKLGIPEKLFPQIIPSGSMAGKLRPDIQKELEISDMDVIAVDSHDSQSAVLAIPAREKDFIFISCGTWSFLGTELDSPVVSHKAEEYNMTNERGYQKKVSFATNITGTWVLQECRRQWKQEGKNCEYAQLEESAMNSITCGCYIDTDDESFQKAGNMPEQISQYCLRTSQPIPKTEGEFVRCIYESLAMKYRVAIEHIMECTGIHYPCIYMVGGGSKSSLLCQLTADICKTKVVAGPSEATAIGNIMVQLIASGDVKDVQEGRTIIRNTQDIKEFQPCNSKDWDAEYKIFITMTNRDH